MATKKKPTGKTAIQRMTHTIDADGRVLGRLATDIAGKLRGKHKPTFEYHQDQGDIVVITNAGKIKTTGAKMTGKVYYRHSGYPGGLKETQMRHMFEKDPSQVLEKAVFNMLPKNKLRAKMMKRLRISN